MLFGASIPEVFHPLRVFFFPGAARKKAGQPPGGGKPPKKGQNLVNTEKFMRIDHFIDQIWSKIWSILRKNILLTKFGLVLMPKTANTPSREKHPN
jgi:hypothetical protein